MIKRDLKIRVVEILGKCPAYKINDFFILKNGYLVIHENCRQICMHSLSSIMPYHVALSSGIKPKQLGLNKKDENKAYVQCLDPCNYSGGGTVIFEIEVGE